MRYDFKEEVIRNQFWLLIGGILFIAAGLTILLTFYIPKEWVNLVLIIAFAIGGLVSLIQAHRFWYKKEVGMKHVGFWLHILSGLFYLSLAVLFLLNFKYFIYPYIFIFLYLLLVSFLVIGIFRVSVSIQQRLSYGWLWTFYCGVVDLLLLILIICGIYFIPFATLAFATGGDMLATGIALVALSIAAGQLKRQ